MKLSAATNREGCISASGSSAGGCIRLPDSTAEGSQSVKEKLWPLANCTREALRDSLVHVLSTKPIDGDHGRLDIGEARKHAKRIEKQSFAIADKYPKDHNDDGTSVMSQYVNSAFKMRSDLQKTIPRGNTYFERLADERFLMRRTFFDRPTRESPTPEEFKTKPLFCQGLERSQKRVCLSNRSFGTTDETAAAPICLKEPGLRDNLFAVYAGIAHSETIRKLPDPVGRNNSNLNMESTGTMTTESAIQLVVTMPGNEITDKTAPAFGECLTESKLPKKLSETENDLDDGAALVSATERSGTDQKELHVNANMLQRVGAWYLKHAFMKEAGFVQPTLKMSNERLAELKGILKDDTNLLTMLGLLVEDEPEGKARVSAEEVEDEPEGEARVNGAEEVEDEPEGEARVNGR